MPKNIGSDISQITDYLYISAWPRHEHLDEIRAKNVRLILSMHWIKPASTLGMPPIRLLWLPTLDTPLVPMPMGYLCRGVKAAIPVIQNNHRVLVHCRYGVHRSVAMACCVLIGMGVCAQEAIQLVKEKREAADPDIWYIRSRIFKFEKVWTEKYC